MIVIFKIGTLPGDEPDESFIQDSVFERPMKYWLINDQPNTQFTQDIPARRVFNTQRFNIGDTVICHF